LAVNEREVFPVLDALIYADVTTGPAGQFFDFDHCIDEIVEWSGTSRAAKNTTRSARHGAASARWSRGS
jgi:hypothetical protein